MPVYKLQIVHADNPALVVTFPGGGPLERDFIQACVDAICQRPVGLFRTERQVRQAVEAGITDVVRSLKYETVSLPR